jgi:hypothetical protein
MASRLEVKVGVADDVMLTWPELGTMIHGAEAGLHDLRCRASMP